MNVNELIHKFESNIVINDNKKNNKTNENIDMIKFKVIKRENITKIKEIENKLYNKNNSKNRRRNFILNDEETKNEFKLLINSTKSIINDILLDKNKIKNLDLNNELLNVIKLFKYFINEDDGIKILINEHIINYLIYILNYKNFFNETNQNLSFDYLEKIITNSESYDFLLINEIFIDFILKNFQTIIETFKNNKENNNNLSEFENIKINGILNIIILLSKEKIICEKININDLIFILNNQVSLKKSIIANFLEIIKNYLILNNNDKIIYEENFIILLLNLFKSNNDDINIIKNIINIIHNNINNEKFIINLINKNLVQFLISIFSQNKNENQKRNSQNFIINLLLIIDLVDKNEKFFKDFMNKNNIIEIIQQIEENLFNSKLVEITLNLINKCSKKILLPDLNNLFFTETNEIFIKILNKYIGTCQNNIIKETLELIYISCSNKSNLLFYSEKSMDLLIKLYQTYLDNEDIIFEILQILNIIYENESISIENFDFDSLIFNISEIFQKYINNNKLIHILSSLLFNLAKRNIETFNIFNLILNNCLYFMEETNVDINEYHEILDTLFNIISIEKNFAEINKYILFLIEKIFPKLLDLKISLYLLQKILSILYLFITKSTLNELNLNKDYIFKLLSKINQKKIFDDFTLSTYSKILKYLCSKYDEANSEKISKMNFYYLFENLNNLLDKIDDIYLQDILDDLIIISLFFRLNENEDNNINISKNIYNISFKIFDKIIKENNIENLKKIIDIIKNICNKNVLIKNVFNQNDRNLIEEIKIYLLQNENNEDLKINNHLIEYSLKSFEIVLYSNDISEKEVNYQKIIFDKNKNLNSDIFNSMSSTDSEINESDISLDKEKLDFLSMETIINYYTLKQDYKHVYLKFDDELRFFSIYTKNNNNMINILDELSIDKIDSCVRSCSDDAFKMKKVHIFKKKPNALKCFIILGKKNVNKKQKTYCFECSDEITCIKYVDCISELIEKNKKQKL